jgi:hypothetical protein
VEDAVDRPPQRSGRFITVFGEDDRTISGRQCRDTPRVFTRMQMGVHDVGGEFFERLDEPWKKAQIAAAPAADGHDRKTERFAFGRFQGVGIDRDDGHVDAGARKTGAQAAQQSFGAAALKMLHHVDDT